ncbi:hypothetical protein ACL03H_15620 [Saccharopolyspora sp. MS10]|uniref:hypothetical protein n=1 Tax=Saccharopolyspora sp. MS10 TaxID=3385973 RepID=UPI0039A217E5
MTDSRQQPDIDFVAVVEAEELRFSEAPESCVRFFGSSEYDADSGSVRRGLPDSVENDVTYRRTRVDYHIRSTLLDRFPDFPEPG